MMDENPFDDKEGAGAGMDRPETDVVRPQTKNLLIDAVFQQSFKRLDQRKRFDPFYLDGQNNFDPVSPPFSEDLENVFGRYVDNPPPASGGMGDMSQQEQPPGANPFDVQEDTPQSAGTPQGPDRAGGMNSNVDPYGEDMRSALRKIVRSV